MQIPRFHTQVWYKLLKFSTVNCTDKTVMIALRIFSGKIPMSCYKGGLDVKHQIVPTARTKHLIYSDQLKKHGIASSRIEFPLGIPIPVDRSLNNIPFMNSYSTGLVSCLVSGVNYVNPFTNQDESYIDIIFLGTLPTNQLRNNEVL